jgi:hypothetical protein
MFCSACGPSLRERMPGLERFLLNREASGILQSVRIYAYFVDPEQSHAHRQSGISAVVNMETGRSHVFSEIAFLPFGFVLDVGEEPIDGGLADITFFGSGFSYAQEADIRVRLPVRAVNSPLPADFRNRRSIREALENRDRDPSG